jgi:hypothetical protein
MLNANGSKLTDNRSAASQWAQQALSLPEVQVQVRVRGNHLHILCEAAQCPSQELLTARFSEALAETDLTELLAPDRPKIYQLFLCGRKLGSRQNDWTVRLDCTAPRQTAKQTAKTKAAEVQLEEQPELEPSPQPKKGGLFGKFTNENRQLQPAAPAVARSPESVQLREEMDFDPDPLPVAARIHRIEDFETSPIAIDTSASSDFAPPSIPQRASRGAATLVQTRPETEQPQGTLTVSTEGLARRGYPDAIASYLSEILGPMGVAVKVTIREKELKSSLETLHPDAPEHLKSKERRLLVLCESAYSPDPSLLAEPIAAKLRKLKLEDFRDAIVGSQVSGEAKPDWLLRVDLTPPDKILKEWARWGDVQAIAKLLNQQLSSLRIHVRATLKETTLHLFCSKALRKGETPKGKEYPDKHETARAIAPMLAAFAPQGISAATLYGVEPAADDRADPESPVWIDWVDLPAAHHPDLAPSARTLAASGDRSSLNFLLNRSINPNLKRKLQTGGIQAVAVRKDGVLHVMTEALTCPSQSKVGPAVAKLLQQLEIPDISGVRVYGRRAGQKMPLWRYGIDLKTAGDLVRSPAKSSKLAAPPLDVFEKDALQEFALSDTGGSLSDFGDSMAFSAGVATDARRRVKIGFPGAKLGEAILHALAQPLVASSLFVPNDSLSTGAAGAGGVSPDRAAGIALVWAIAGCLLVFNTDWVLGMLLKSAGVSQTASVSEVCQGPDCQPPIHKTPSQQVGTQQAQTQQDRTEVRSEQLNPNTEIPDDPAAEVNLSRIPWEPSPEANQQEAFNDSGFTKPGNTSVPLTADEPPAAPVFPSLRSEQLDEQLARYQEYIRTHKQPPDILIVGSSRALRGIDPQVLEKALAEQGYPGLRVYNFGINGATLQVVDAIVRRILPISQLPKSILLADGARALNSGRPDLTFSAIASSEGYRQLARGSFTIRTDRLQGPAVAEANNPVTAASELAQSLQETQANIQQFVSQKLVAGSAVYGKREHLKDWLRAIVNPSVSGGGGIENDPQTGTNGQPTAETTEVGEFAPNGFLPVLVRFNPETYFKKHPKVSGYYDSDYQDFKLTGVQSVALKNLIEFTRVRNINLVFVNMPLTQDYLDPVRAGYEQQFRQHMTQLAAQSGLIFRDKSMLWPSAKDFFSDPSHLNRYGAVEVAEQLARDPLIPWPVKR